MFKGNAPQTGILTGLKQDERKGECHRCRAATAPQADGLRNITGVVNGNHT
jgi:hypothetical protein